LVGLLLGGEGKGGFEGTLKTSAWRKSGQRAKKKEKGEESQKDPGESGLNLVPEWVWVREDTLGKNEQKRGR